MPDSRSTLQIAQWFNSLTLEKQKNIFREFIFQNANFGLPDEQKEELDSHLNAINEKFNYDEVLDGFNQATDHGEKWFTFLNDNKDFKQYSRSVGA